MSQYGNKECSKSQKARSISIPEGSPTLNQNFFYGYGKADRLRRYSQMLSKLRVNTNARDLAYSSFPPPDLLVLKYGDSRLICYCYYLSDYSMLLSCALLVAISDEAAVLGKMLSTIITRSSPNHLPSLSNSSPALQLYSFAYACENGLVDRPATPDQERTFL